MPSKDSTDLLMFFKIAGERYVSGESLTAIDTGPGGLMDGFRTGHFFEVEDFKFGIGVDDGDAGADDDDPANGRRQGIHSPQRNGSHLGHAQAGKAKKPRSGKFSKFINPDGTGMDLQFPIEVQPFSFTRTMDKASPGLFQACATLQVFEQVAMVKRKFTGDKQHLEAFMRIDFLKVLITRIEWSDDDAVRESYEFVCREIDVAYRKQDRSGHFIDGTNTGRWVAERKPVTHQGRS